MALEEKFEIEIPDDDAEKCAPFRTRFGVLHRKACQVINKSRIWFFAAEQPPIP